MFCPKCKSIMFPVEGELQCRRCGYNRSIKDEDGQSIKEEANQQDMVVIDELNDTLPKTKVRCSKCGYNEAYWILRQTRSADEPETRIYRCVKCAHSWREY